MMIIYKNYTYSKLTEQFHFDYNIPRTTLQWHKRDLHKILLYITIEDQIKLFQENSPLKK